MISNNYIEIAVKDFERLKLDHPELSSEERSAILITAAIKNVSQRLLHLDSTLDSMKVEAI